MSKRKTTTREAPAQELAEPVQMGEEAMARRIPPFDPDPFPFPPDWWRCRRVGPVSGRFYGEMSTPSSGQYALDLRVDIDPRSATSPVMNCLSGDLYRVFRLQFFGHVYRWTIYQESWVLENPTVTWSQCEVNISGDISFWKGAHPTTTLDVTIPWGSFVPASSAQVTFTEVGGTTSTYQCTKQSNAFRDVQLEIDVCDSINVEPLMPDCDTHAHPVRPAALTQRQVKIEDAYLDAGINLTINPNHTIIDDSAADFTTWSAAELHDAMEQYFSQYPHAWPRWNMWCLLASTFDSPSVGGIMFDAAAIYGGAGQAPERQGCAVFRSHSWFNDLVPGVPSNDDEAWAMRHYLYTYVHEIGHAFNFLHSWDKGRADSLSWMNYDWRYDSLPGHNTDDFWGNFLFRFDDEELLHMRHGDRAAVIMGGDPWASGGHLEAPGGALADIIGEAPIELMVRSKEYFSFMEPVIIELRLRNKADMSLTIDTNLHPEFGSTTIYIRRPDGRILQYQPIMCKLATPEMNTLQALNGGEPGTDRVSQSVMLSYGAYGYYFDVPGEYTLRVMYQGAGGLVIPSNIHRIRIGQPFTREEDRLAQDYFTYETGMALYLDGSSSPFLSKGMDTLQEVAEQLDDTAAGAQVSLVLAQNLARPFFRIEDEKVVKARDAQPEEALELTARALKQHKKDDTTFTNLDIHQVRRTRADILADMGEKPKAKKELETLIKELRENGVNQPVLDEIREYAETL